MKRIAIVVLLACGCAPTSGVELTYRTQGDKVAASRTMKERLDASGLKGTVDLRGDDIVVRLPGATPQRLAACRALFSVVGRFGLRIVGDRPAHEAATPPAGYEAMTAPADRDRITYPWIGDRVLVRTEPVMADGDIESATAEPNLQMGQARWCVSFRMKPGAAKAFDLAAAELFARTPKGQIAIVLDGVIMSMPVVMATQFAGHAEVTGNFTEDEARALAAALRSGALPAPVQLLTETEYGRR